MAKNQHSSSRRDITRYDEEGLLQHLVRISTPTLKRQEAMQREAQEIQDLVQLVESLAERTEEVAELWDRVQRPDLAKLAHEAERKELRFAQELTERVISLLTCDLELHPEHEEEWVRRLYQELAEVRAALVMLFEAVVNNIAATNDLRQITEETYQALTQQLARAEDDPDAALSTFTLFVRFVEMILKLALKFGGPVEQVWQTQAGVIVPLLR